MNLPPWAGRWWVLVLMLALIGAGFWLWRAGHEAPSVLEQPLSPDPARPSAGEEPRRILVEGQVFLETAEPGTVPMPVTPAPAGTCRVRAWQGGVPRSEPVTCDAEGRFELSVARAAGGPVAIAIEVPGRLRAVLEPELGDEPRGRLPPVALGWAEVVTGRVVDARGQPLPDIELQARPQPDLAEPEPWRARTTTSGAFRFDTLPPGPVAIRAVRPGFAPVIVQAVAPQDEIWIELEALTDFRGRVVGPPEAVARARVRLEGSGVWPLREVMADADGGFVFEAIPEGVYAVEAVVEDDDAPLASLPLENVTPDQQATLALIPAQRLTVSVVDPGGAPVAGARVSVASAQLGLLRRVATTDASGTTVLGPWVPGHYVVRADAEGWLPAEAVALTIEDAPPAPVTLRLRTPGWIAGRVEDERGVGISGAEVRVRSDALFVLGDSRARAQMFQSALEQRDHMLGVTVGPVPPLPSFEAAGETLDQKVVSQSEGRFRLEALMAGTYRLEASHPEYGPSEVVELTLASGGSAQGVRLVLRRGVRLVGRVLDTNLRPIEGALATVDDERHSLTDARGQFVLGSLRDRATLVVQADGYAPHRGVVTVREPETEVEIVLQTADARAEGRVVDARGEPVVGAIVHVQPRDGLSPHRTVRTDRRGLWQLDGLPAGEVEFEATHVDHAPAGTVVAVVAGASTRVDLTLGAGWTLEVAVRTAGPDQPIAGARIQIGGRLEFTDAQGRAVLDRLGEPSLRVQVSAPGHGTATRVVDRPRGDDRLAIVVALQRGGRIEGTTTDYRGDPVAGARVRLRDGAGQVLGEQRTSARGTWRFDGIPEGPVTIEATPPPDRQEELAEVALDSDVLEGRVTAEVDVRFDRQ